jgi:hypothetical protein
MAKRYRGIYEIDGVRTDRFEIDLLTAVQDLHQAATGPSELFHETIVHLRGFIMARTMDWVDSMPHTALYDEAVLRLCSAVLDEYIGRFPDERPPEVKILDKDTE